MRRASSGEHALPLVWSVLHVACPVGLLSKKQKARPEGEACIDSSCAQRFQSQAVKVSTCLLRM